MIKVLLVDDEPLCLIGLQSLLNWNELGFELTDTAQNGAAALEIIKSEQVDIVVTDLKMPVMGGLELAEKCRETDDALPAFIMLTNYEEFQYVKESLRLGAAEYLTKIDLTAESLTAALLRAKEQVQKERILRSPEGYSTGRDLEQYRNLLFNRLYSGMYDTRESFDAQCAELNLKLDAPNYVTAYASLITKELDTEQSAALCLAVVGMTRDILPKYAPGSTVTGMDLNHFAALIPLQTTEDLEKNLRPTLDKTCTILFQYFNAKIQWAVGLPVQNILQAKDSLRSAASMLTQMEPEQKVSFCRSTGMGPLDHRARLVERVQEYIRTNLSKRLSLNDVASEFNFSPSYLSQLLSKNGEAGFVEFVTATRIDSAKELMATTDMRVYEISDAVGFASASYFSKVFKKLEGMSPQAYMQNMRK